MPRVLAIGIDGAPPRLLRRWMAEGELPALASLCDDGSFGVLRSTANVVSASAWTSISTGVNPGRHGVFGFFDREPGTWRFRQNNARSGAAEPYWVTASRAGALTATLNMPVSWPVDAVRGIQVAGWLAPSDASDGFAYPPDLADELRAEFGSYPLHSDVQRLVATGRHRAARDRIVSNIRRKAEIAEALLLRERWELMTLVFSDTDAAAHYYWHLTDTSHSRHDPALRDEVGEILLLAYREVDEAIARLVARLDGLDTVLVISDHGAGPSRDGALYLPGLVDALGWQIRRRGILRSMARALGQRLPAGLKHRLADIVDGLGGDRTSRMLLGNVDRRRTRVLSFYQGGRADLWMNPDRSAEWSADERAAFRNEVRETLLECRESRTGEPVIADIVPREDAYRGPRVERSPELLVQWREDISGIRGLRCGSVESARPELEPLQTCDHRPEGVILAAGRGIARGATLRATVEDVAPTLLHLCGLPVPERMDGSVVTGVSSAANRPSVDGRAATESVDEPPGEMHEESVARLRGLGYLSGDGSSDSSRS